MITSQVRHPKPSAAPSQRIPSPFMVLQGVGFEFCSFSRCRNLGRRGGQRTKSAIRNQVRTAASGSPLPLRERARVRVTRASAALRAEARAPKPQTYPCKRPLWERVSARASRASRPRRLRASPLLQRLYIIHHMPNLIVRKHAARARHAGVGDAVVDESEQNAVWMQGDVRYQVRRRRVERRAGWAVARAGFAVAA